MTAPDNPGDGGGYYTVSEAAAKLGVTEQRVRQLCGDEDIEATKKGGRWRVARRAVHERFAVRPPKVRASGEEALEEQRSQIRELREENRILAVLLGQVLAPSAGLREEVEYLTRTLEECSRDFAAGREELKNLRQSKEELSRELEESRAKIEELERQIRDGSPAPLGDKRPRLIRDPSDDPGPRRRRPSE